LVEGLVEDVGIAEGNFGFDMGYAAEARRLASKDRGKDCGLALDDSLLVLVDDNGEKIGFLEAGCLGSCPAGNQHSRYRTTLLRE
jgi:hypothetical protein